MVCLSANSAQDSEASQVVANLHSALLEVMKNAARLGYPGRYQRLETVVTASHDLPFIARMTVGRYWKGLDQSQKANFVATFRQLSIATYASRFDGYAGETFALSEAQDHPRGRRLVRSLLTKSNGEPVYFDYLLHRVDGQWRIINVIVDGVSDLALKRSQYRSVIRKDGMASLITKLKEKIARYSK